MTKVRNNYYGLREQKKILSKNGYNLIRKNGGHAIYRNDEQNTIVIQDHGSVAQRNSEQKFRTIIKKFNLEV